MNKEEGSAAADHESLISEESITVDSPFNIQNNSKSDTSSESDSEKGSTKRKSSRRKRYKNSNF